MKINWFPGHMNKALKDIADQLKKVDVVLYLLDARIPISSKNPSLSKLTENKPVLYIINKIDMADEKRVAELFQENLTKLSQKSNHSAQTNWSDINQKVSNQAYAQWLWAFQTAEKALL